MRAACATTDTPAFTPADLVVRVAEHEYYAVLGAASGEKLDSCSSQSALRSAYRKAALALHPDKELSASADAWHVVRQAYLVLSNEAQRAHYDAGDKVDFDHLVVDELDTLPVWTTEPGAEALKFFMGNGDLVDHGSKISLLKPVIKNMPRKLKGNKQGDVSYVSKNAATGKAINVLFHDGEWKWLRSKRQYEPAELMRALQTEQRLSAIGIDAFGLGAGHTQDWLKALEQQGCGQTPEGREKLVGAAEAQLLRITQHTPDVSDGADEQGDTSGSPASPSPAERPGLLVPRKLEVIHTALLQCAEVHDADDTLEASNPYSKNGCSRKRLREFGLV